MRQGLRKPACALAFGLVVAGCSTQGGTERIAGRALGAGEPLRVACVSLPVYGAPSGYANTLASLGFGETVQVLELARTNAGGRDTDPPAATASWARVAHAGGSGFVATRCLVDEPLFAAQTAAEAASARNAEFERVAGRGFGDDDEDAEFVASRGAFGAAGARGVMNFGGVDALITAPRPRSAADVAAFLADGELDGAPQ